MKSLVVALCFDFVPVDLVPVDFAADFCFRDVIGVDSAVVVDSLAE
jgi:hypothetical protein